MTDREITGLIIERIPSSEPYAYLEIRLNIYNGDPSSAVRLLEMTRKELEIDERGEKPDPTKKKTVENESDSLSIYQIPKEFREYVKPTEDDKYHYVRIKKILPTEKFKELAHFLKGLGYEYVSEGKKSHFRKAKK